MTNQEGAMRKTFIAGAVLLWILTLAGLAWASPQGNPPSVECASELWNGEFWKVQVNGSLGEIETNVPGGILADLGEEFVWINQHTNDVFRWIIKGGNDPSIVNEGVWPPTWGDHDTPPSNVSHVTFCWTDTPSNTTTSTSPTSTTSSTTVTSSTTTTTSTSSTTTSSTTTTTSSTPTTTEPPTTTTTDPSTTTTEPSSTTTTTTPTSTTTTTVTTVPPSSTTTVTSTTEPPTTTTTVPISTTTTSGSPTTTTTSTVPCADADCDELPRTGTTVDPLLLAALGAALLLGGRGVLWLTRKAS